MMLQYIEMNILDIKKGIICHQVNCIGAMGAGLALQVATRFPECYRMYEGLCQRDHKKFDLLGHNYIFRASPGLWIVNMFAQKNISRKGRATDYQAFESCLQDLWNSVARRDLKHDIYFPYMIGCGLGGGDWKVIEPLIQKYFNAFICHLPTLT
jgi:O-acetyl-ADP-ribose deacetylase (regulator of RNase III)